MAEEKPRNVMRDEARKVETLDVFGVTWRFAPAGFHSLAEQYLGAAKAAPDAAFTPARAFLACRSIELLLKAYLAARGQSLASLAGGAFAHNLQSTFDIAKEKGLLEKATLDDRHIDQIKRASDYYSNKILEYPALMEALKGYPQFPDVSILIDAADLLVGELRTLCFE